MPPGCKILDEEAIARLKASPPLADHADTRAEAPAYMIYTSGTTTRPKGVVHAHRTALGRVPMHRDWQGLTADDVMLHAGAFNWSYTLGVGLLDPWACGATAVLYNGPKDIEVWPKLIDAVGATLFAAVPSLYRQMLKYCDLAPGSLTDTAAWPCRRRSAEPCNPRELARGDGQGNLRGVRHERMLDLHLQPCRHADPPRQSRQAAARPAHRGDSDFRPDRSRLPQAKSACSPSIARIPA